MANKQSTPIEAEIAEPETIKKEKQQNKREIVAKQDITTTNQLSINKEMIEGLKKRYELFKKIQEEVLETGVDYGFPFTPKEITPITKPSLYKSGAEKLLMMFNLQPEFEVLETIENEKIVFYKFKCELIDRNTGAKVGEGYGLANSKEKPSWSSNPLGYANVILKIAKKRAMVDATLTTLGASNFFTQDIEDMQELLTISEKKMTPQQVKQYAPPTEEQWKLFDDLIKRYAKHLKKEDGEVLNSIINKYGVNDVNSLSKQQVSDAISRILKALKSGGNKKHEEKQNTTKKTPQEEFKQLLNEYLEKTGEEDFFMIRSMKLNEKIRILKEALQKNITISDIIGKDTEETTIEYEVLQDIKDNLFDEEK